VQVEAHQPLVDGDAVTGQRDDESLMPQGRRADGVQISQVADALMPVLDEVAGAATRTGDVVGEHTVGVEESRRSIREHDRRARPLLREQVAVVVDSRHDDQPVDAPGHEALHQFALSCRLFVKAPGEDPHAARARHILDPAMERG
jgi:hypothetical protein